MGHWQIQKKAFCHRLSRLSKKRPAKRSPDTSLILSSAYPARMPLRNLGSTRRQRWIAGAKLPPALKAPSACFQVCLKSSQHSPTTAANLASSPRDEYAEEIAPLGFDKYFEHIILVEDTTEHKPAPAPMLEYLRRTGANPGNVVYVGDTVYDEQCATSAGVSFARAALGSHQDIPNATYNLETPNDLLTLTTK